MDQLFDDWLTIARNKLKHGLQPDKLPACPHCGGHHCSLDMQTGKLKCQCGFEANVKV